MLLVTLAAGAAQAQLVPPKSPDLKLHEPQYALGVRVRGLWVTPVMMSSFLSTSTLLENASLRLRSARPLPRQELRSDGGRSEEGEQHDPVERLAHRQRVVRQLEEEIDQ